MHKILSALFALFAFFPLTFASGAAHAQYGSAYASPSIGGFDVEQVRKLAAGTELNFTLYGTPGGIAIVSIPGAAGRFLLEEVETGLYVGTYTIKSADRIASDSRVTANLRLGYQVASVVLDEPLIAPMTAAQQKAAAAAAGPAPRIDRFDVVPNQLVAGSDLLFSLQGTAGGRANVRMEGVRGRLFLNETRAGVYEGTYTIKTRDRITPDSKATAILRQGDQRASTVLGRSMLAASGVQPGARRVARSCANCGAVEAINVIEVKGDGGYLGMIAGGVIGGLLGHQVGGGRGQTAATVLGAAGGAVAGREVEKRVNVAKHYEVIVRLDSGGTQAVSYEALPGFTVGEKVRVENGTLVRNPS